MAVCSYI